jgi:prophage regulatory protein
MPTTHQTTDTIEPKRPTRKPLQYRPDSEIVRERHLPIVTGLSSATLWRRRREGDFPPGLRLGPNAVGWRRADIHEWLASRRQA